MRRRVKPNERLLWENAMRGVRRIVAASTPIPEPPSVSAVARSVVHVAPRSKLPDSNKPRIAPQAPTLDGDTEQRLRKGHARVDARLDLHGLLERDAHNALASFLDDSVRRGHRIVLVITGKGQLGQGVIRRSLPLWLETPALRRHVTAFRPAFDKHGGEGAMYILLRRHRR